MFFFICNTKECTLEKWRRKMKGQINKCTWNCERYWTGIIPVAKVGIINLSYLAFISGQDWRKLQNGKNSALVYWITINNLKQLQSYLLQISGQLIMLLCSFIIATSFYQEMMGGFKLMYISLTTILVAQFFSREKELLHSLLDTAAIQIWFYINSSWFVAHLLLMKQKTRNKIMYFVKVN